MVNFSPEQFQDYRNRSISFKHLTEECIPVLTETGKLIQNTFTDKETPRSFVFCHDIIKRVRENLFFLTQSNPPQEHNSIPLQLILRSVFSDLIILTYVIDNLGNSDVVDAFLCANDLKAVEGKRTFADCEKEFLILCNKEEWTNFFDTKQAELSDTAEDIVAPFQSKNKLKNTTITEITKIAEYFKGKSELKPLYALLFGPFKMLSQVEHYANENRSYSYFNKNTAFFFQKFALSYKLVIEWLCKELEFYLQRI